MIKKLESLGQNILAPIKQRQFIKFLTQTTEDQFKRIDLAPIPVRFAPSDEPKSPTDLILRKTDGGIVALFMQATGAYDLRYFSNRIATYVYWFAHTSSAVTKMSVDISDGNRPTDARYRFSVTSPHYVPLPDPYFFQSRGYANMDEVTARNPTPWDARSDQVIWRGGLHGDGVFSLDPAMANNPTVIPRLRMALACKKTDIDFRFVIRDETPFAPVLEQAGLVADFVQPKTWNTMKYGIDIDGFTCAWNNYMQRLRLGCCVLKVDSAMGYYQWFYDRLQPWEHFIPIKADLSDLSKNLDWARSNPAKAKEIAVAGQSVARSLTFDVARNWAVAAIEEREARG